MYPFIQKLEKRDEILARINRRFDHLDVKLNTLTIKIIQQNTRLERIEENMATKADMHNI